MGAGDPSMRILAFDTCTRTASVAVVDDGETLCEITAGVEARHGETLLPRIADALEQAGVPFEAIDLIAVGIGPGSFTGVRVGLATAKGLALASDKPLRGVVSLRTLARGAPGSERLVAAALDGYKNEVYLALYARDGQGRLEERLAPLHARPGPAATALSEVSGEQAVLLVGDGARRYADEIYEPMAGRARLAGPAFDQPLAGHLAREARQAFEEQGPSDLFSLEPLYLRPSDARLPKNRPVPPGGDAT